MAWSIENSRLVYCRPWCHQILCVCRLPFSMARKQSRTQEEWCKQSQQERQTQMAAEWFWTGRATPCTSILGTRCQCDIINVLHPPHHVYLGRILWLPALSARQCMALTRLTCKTSAAEYASVHVWQDTSFTCYSNEHSY